MSPCAALRWPLCVRSPVVCMRFCISVEGSVWECVWSCLSAPEGISTFANSMRGGMPMPQVGAVGINVSLCLCGVDMCLCSSLWTCFCVFVCVCVCQRGGGREREGGDNQKSARSQTQIHSPLACCPPLAPRAARVVEIARFSRPALCVLMKVKTGTLKSYSP